MNRRSINRRDFMVRAGKSGLIMAGAAALGAGLHTKAPPLIQSRQSLTILPDFSIPEQKNRLVVVRGDDRAKSLQAGLKALGGLDNFIRPKDRVLIKVNAAFATPPLVGATTHPELLAETIRLCRRAGAGKITVCDNPIQDPAACFNFTGLAAVCNDLGVGLQLPQPASFQSFTLPRGRLIEDWPVLVEPLLDADKLIGLAPVKDHHRSGASMIMKGWYGFLGGRRAVFHQDIHTIIGELARMINPTLVVLDGIRTMMRNGPTGGSLDDLKRTDTLIVSTDQVAADAAGAGLLDKTIADLPFIARAAREGLGVSDYRSLSPEYVDAG